MGRKGKKELTMSGQDARLFAAVSDAAKRIGQPAYVVGGYVRDAILGRPNVDVDIVTVGSGIDLAKETAKELGGRRVSIFKNFGTAQFRLGELEVEFVGARKESYRANSRKPIVENGTLEEDLSRRDFTINAMALNLESGKMGTLIDLFHGQKDLENKLIRTPLDPTVTFDDDPLRMMRAIRFATQLDFEIDPKAIAAMRDCAPRLSIVSKERIIDEFNKILLSSRPSKGLILLESTGLLKEFFPDLAVLKGVENLEGKGHKDNFLHTAQVVDNVVATGGDLWLRWAALLHDVGKAQTKKFIPGQGWTFHSHEYVGSKMIKRIFRQLHLPLDERMRGVQKLVALHMRPIALSDDEVTDSAVRRLLFDAGDDIDRLMTLCEADITSKNPRKVERYLRNFQRVREKLRDLEERDAIRNFQPPVTGEVIMAYYGLPPCMEVGMIKCAIKEAIIEGKIANDFDQAFDYMKMVGEKMRLTPAKDEG